MGEGTTNFLGNYHDPAAGILHSNLPVDGRGLIVSINTATGVIHTGDDGAGLTSQNYRGDAITINEGVITTGDGVVGQVDGLLHRYLRQAVPFAGHAGALGRLRCGHDGLCAQQRQHHGRRSGHRQWR